MLNKTKQNQSLYTSSFEIIEGKIGAFHWDSKNYGELEKIKIFQNLEGLLFYNGTRDGKKCSE